MIRTIPVVLAAWLLVAAPAKAASPLACTRMILEQARTIVASSQTHNEKLAALSALFSNFFDSPERPLPCNGVKPGPYLVLPLLPR